MRDVDGRDVVASAAPANSFGDIAPQAIAGFDVGLSMTVVLDPEEFGALTMRTARYFEEIGVPIASWAVVSEPEPYPKNRMDPTWTVERDCERFRRFVDALRSVHPAAVVTGPAIPSS